MLIERLLAVTAAGPMLGGLNWRPPAGGRHSMRRLHEARNLTSDATHYTLLSTPHAVVYGLFQPRASEEAVRLSKGVQSAAHCFAARVGQEAPNGALLLRVRPHGSRKDEMVYVVVLEGGVPVVDALTSELEARNALGSEDRPIWTDSPGSYPNGEAADFDWLAQGAGKASRVSPIPINPWPLLTAAAVLALVSGGWWWASEVRRADALRLEARQREANDPAPKYLAALALESSRMVTDRNDWLRAVGDLFDRQVSLPGWRMKSTDCHAASGRCETVWARQGGTFDDLTSALPDEVLILPRHDTNPASALDMARTSTSLRIERSGLPPGPPLPSFGDALGNAGSLFQVWKTAALTVDIKPPRLWPRVDAVPAQFDHPRSVLSGTISLGDVPGPFVLEALRTAPPWISWESVRADIGDGDAAARLKFRATGVYYVALH